MFHKVETREADFQIGSYARRRICTPSPPGSAFGSSSTSAYTIHSRLPSSSSRNANFPSVRLCVLKYLCSSSTCVRQAPLGWTTRTNERERHFFEARAGGRLVRGNSLISTPVCPKNAVLVRKRDL